MECGRSFDAVRNCNGRGGTQGGGALWSTSDQPSGVLSSLRREIKMDFLAACDASGAPLSFEDWWHRNTYRAGGESYDICNAEYIKLSLEEQATFIRISSRAELERIFGPPPGDDGETAVVSEDWAEESEPDAAAVLALEKACTALEELLLRAGAGGSICAADVVAHCNRVVDDEGITTDTARAAIIRVVKARSGLAYQRGADGRGELTVTSAYTSTPHIKE